MTVQDSKPLETILEKVDEVVDGEKTDLRTVLDAFGDRAFGPVLTLCGLFMLTPLGAIPGAPIVLCIIILSFSIQIIVGRSRPWLPKILRKVEVTQDKIDTTRDKIEPVFEKMDVFVRPRLGWAATKTFRLITAFLSCFLALSLLPFGAVPFGAVIPGLIIAVLGMGIMARDGVLILVGFALTALAIILISQMII